MGWSEKYKKSIDCDNPKGFSQRAHCQGRKKKMKEETLDYMSEGDFWHPDPEKDKKLPGKGPQMRAREDSGQSTSAQTKPDYSRRLKPGESYMDFAKRKQAERTRKEEKDHEYSMARSEISTIISAAKRLKKKMGKGEGNLEAWVQSKITKAADYIDSAADYADSGEMKEEANGKCKAGYYYCHTDKKCKPISKGMRVTSRYFGNGKEPEEVGIDAPVEGNGESNGNGNGNGMGEEVVHEGGSLHAWFGKSKSKDGKPGWVQSDGSPCANEPGETKTPKCYSSRRLAGLKKTKEGKKKIRSADARKSRQDPGQQQKSGGAKPTMVRTFKDKKDYKKHPSGDTKTQESMEYTTEATKDKKGAGSGTKDACYNKVKSRYSVWPSAYASGALVKCRKVGADNWGNKTNKEEYEFSENVSSGKSILAKSGRVQGKVVGAVSNAEKTSEKAKKSAINKAKEKSAGEAAYKVASEKGKSPYDALIAKKAAEKKAERERLSSERKAEAEKFKGKRFARIREEYEFSSWRDDFQAMEYEFVDIIKPEPIKGVQIDEIHSSAHTPHEVPSKELGKLVKKAVKRIDTDVDGDTDHNDKAKGELGEFIPGVGNKRLYSMTRPKTAKENFSNWREDLGEDWQKVNKSDKTDGMSPAAVKAYRRENPGSKLKTAVTGDPKPGSKDAKRRKSFCSRSKGQQDMHNIDCSKDPDKAICKARRRWKC